MHIFLLVLAAGSSANWSNRHCGEPIDTQALLANHKNIQVSALACCDQKALEVLREKKTYPQSLLRSSASGLVAWCPRESTIEYGVLCRFRNDDGTDLGGELLGCKTNLAFGVACSTSNRQVQAQPHPLKQFGNGLGGFFRSIGEGIGGLGRGILGAASRQDKQVPVQPGLFIQSKPVSLKADPPIEGLKSTCVSSEPQRRCLQKVTSGDHKSLDDCLLDRDCQNSQIQDPRFIDKVLDLAASERNLSADEALFLKCIATFESPGNQWVQFREIQFKDRLKVRNVQSVVRTKGFKPVTETSFLIPKVNDGIDYGMFGLNSRIITHDDFGKFRSFSQDKDSLKRFYGVASSIPDSARFVSIRVKENYSRMVRRTWRGFAPFQEEKDMNTLQYLLLMYMGHNAGAGFVNAGVVARKHLEKYVKLPFRDEKSYESESNEIVKLAISDYEAIHKAKFSRPAATDFDALKERFRRVRNFYYRCLGPALWARSDTKPMPWQPLIDACSRN